VVERYLRRNDVRARIAVEHALELAAILTARELTDPAELRRARRRTGIPDPAKLFGALLEHYEWWVTYDAVHTKDPRYGARTLAEETVQRIPTAMWGSGGPQDGVPRGLRGPAPQADVTASLRRPPHAVRK
jgi:hypothetical protein